MKVEAQYPVALWPFAGPSPCLFPQNLIQRRILALWVCVEATKRRSDTIEGEGSRGLYQ